MSPPRLFGRLSVLAPTGAESAAFDRHAIDELGIPDPVLMENAGRSAALVLDRVFPRGAVSVLVGSGNNGGDGVVLARTLASAGRPVRVVAVGPRPDPEPLLHGHRIPIEAVPEEGPLLAQLLAESGVVVDALLGTGVRGAAREPHARAIRALNEAAVPVLSLDVPSGVDADSGAAPGEAVQADVTVAFGAPKLGTLLHPGRARAGRLVAVEIGFPAFTDGAAGARLITPEWASRTRPRRALVTHKKAEGRLLLVAGDLGMAGAAVLSARAALRAGVGYLRVATHPGNRGILQGTVPEAVLVDAADAEAVAAAAGDTDAVAAGPGLGRGRLAEVLEAILGRAPPGAVLLDADAITRLGSGRLEGFREAADAGTRLLTPHPGEIRSLVDAGPQRIREEPVEVAREAARRWDAVCLLKGAPSVVASPSDDPVWVAAASSSELARAGMGDVLTGAAGAFLARGAGAAEAGALALHYTGRAAALASRGEALLPSDVVDALPLALAEEGPGETDLPFPFVLADLDPPR